MPAWLERLTEEHAELTARIHRLSQFVVGPDFNELPAEEKVLLRAQLPVMVAYETILRQRIAVA